MPRIILYSLLFTNMLIISMKTCADNIYFHGTLIDPPPCVINGDKPIDVDFSDSVVTTKVDGINYKRSIVYTLTCDRNLDSALKMQIKGNTSSFDSALLVSSVSDLGIQIIKNGANVNVNEWMYFQYKNPPKLEAVPVKNKSANLEGGKFHAAATLLVELP